MCTKGLKFRNSPSDEDEFDAEGENEGHHWTPDEEYIDLQCQHFHCRLIFT